MSVKVRLSGDPDEVARTLAVLAEVLEVATEGRPYPNRGSFGVRVYAEVRLPQDASGPVTASAQRMDRRQGVTAGRALAPRNEAQ